MAGSSFSQYGRHSGFWSAGNVCAIRDWHLEEGEEAVHPWEEAPEHQALTPRDHWGRRGQTPPRLSSAVAAAAVTHERARQEAGGHAKGGSFLMVLELPFFPPNSQILMILQRLQRSQSPGKSSYSAFQAGDLVLHGLRCDGTCVIKPLSDLNVCGISMCYQIT